MRRNLAASLRRRRRPCSIKQYDRLPPELRNWLAQAALPWSPVSALRLWWRFLRETAGDTVAASRRLDMAEARMLRKDAPRIWGFTPPAARIYPTGSLRR
ncbi:DUF6525 family protein [Paracoccus alkanivorans]|uniref:Uncharacterized protein n=1 Tax=Paracoccus alkanivorans TaxID=2116655 RepID=A0A3M0MNI1_9RHOB|nr:DUF6525 family protein [Paracoccus alkanivorans]RMC37260.1 hypothetical protein C9E81_00430 [Paracoccus alkanivorans]